MHKLLVRKPDAVVVLIAAYFALEFIVRVAMPHGMRYDESQQAFFSQWLTLGYDSQPPLYNWWQSLVIRGFGLSLASISLVKNIVLFLVYFSYYRLARLLLADAFFAVIATLSLLTIPQLFWEAQRDLTHTVAQLLMINIFLWGVVRTLKAPDTTNYVLTGIALGLGMLTKYNFFLLAAAVLVAVWCHPQGRQRLLDKRFVATILIALLIFLPHGLWLIHHFDLASGRTLGIMEQHAPTNELGKLSRGPLQFFKLVAIICAPTLVVYAIVFQKSFFSSLRTSNQWTRFFATIFVVIGVLVLALIFGIGMTALRDRWLLPFLFLLPLYLCLKLEASGIRAADFAKRFVYIPLALMILIPTALFTRVSFPSLFKSYEAYNVPYDGFVDTVVTAQGKHPGLVLTDDWPPAGNLRLQMRDTPVISLFFANLTPNFTWSADRPILVVWLPRTEKEGVPSYLIAWLDANLGDRYAIRQTDSVDIPYLRGKPNDTFRFGYAWVYPR